ncbi:hypothetical protein M885DRAFT_552520, partial [Pelagophyceae sp. CCMP2097]
MGWWVWTLKAFLHGGLPSETRRTPPGMGAFWDCLRGQAQAVREVRGVGACLGVRGRRGVRLRVVGGAVLAGGPCAGRASRREDVVAESACLALAADLRRRGGPRIDDAALVDKLAVFAFGARVLEEEEARHSGRRRLRRLQLRRHRREALECGRREGPRVGVGAGGQRERGARRGGLRRRWHRCGRLWQLRDHVLDPVPHVGVDARRQVGLQHLGGREQLVEEARVQHDARDHGRGLRLRRLDVGLRQVLREVELDVPRVDELDRRVRGRERARVCAQRRYLGQRRDAHVAEPAERAVAVVRAVQSAAELVADGGGLAPARARADVGLEVVLQAHFDDLWLLPNVQRHVQEHRLERAHRELQVVRQHVRRGPREVRVVGQVQVWFSVVRREDRKRSFVERRPLAVLLDVEVQVLLVDFPDRQGLERGREVRLEDEDVFGSAVGDEVQVALLVGHRGCPLHHLGHLRAVLLDLGVVESRRRLFLDVS